MDTRTNSELHEESKVIVKRVHKAMNNYRMAHGYFPNKVYMNNDYYHILKWSHEAIFQISLPEGKPKIFNMEIDVLANYEDKNIYVGWMEKA
jgi:hypothetical protein